MTVVLKLERWLQDCPLAYRNFVFDLRKDWVGVTEDYPGQFLDRINTELDQYRAKLIVSQDLSWLRIEFEDERGHTWFLLKWS